MGKLRIYFKPIWYNIMHHKAYAGFCVFGTMLTFVFITILLQVTNVIVGNTPPATKADRIVRVNAGIWDERREVFFERKDVEAMMNNVVGCETYTCSHNQNGNILVNNKLLDNGVLFVDAKYWDVFQYKFIKGRPWNKEESRQPYVVINESFAMSYFATDDVIGKEIEFQEITYKVLGVVEDVSMFAYGGNSPVLAPESFSDFLMGRRIVNIHVLFPEGVSVEEMKRRLTNGFNIWAEMASWGSKAQVRYFSTIQELLAEDYGGDLLLVGVGGILFILLCIPLLNIVLLNMANTSVQIAEIGVKRALGANRFVVFMMILSENFVLVIAGLVGGIILVYPVLQCMGLLYLDEDAFGALAVMPQLDWMIILFVVVPLSILFSLIAGGIPAYLNVKRPIVEMLKGGSSC